MKDVVHVSIEFPLEKECRAANAELIHKMVQVLARALKRRSDDSRVPGGPPIPSISGSQDIYIRADPKEVKYPLKKDDINKLETEIRTGGTKSVQFKDVRLLSEAYVTDIAAIHPGGGDQSLLSTPLALKSHIANAFMKISRDASLLRIPPVAMLKLVTLRLSTDDLLFLEHFGNLVWKTR